jgi:predicted ATP-grasp superfamily ATP-dependent carboligase
MRVLVSAISARALAQSVVAAGHDVVVLDGFGDLDCPGEVHVTWPFTPRRAVSRAVALASDAIAFGAPWEHAPALMARTAEGRRLLGASPEAVRAARDPRRVRDALRRAGLPALDVAVGSRAAWPTAPFALKPRAGGGGRGVVAVAEPRQLARLPRGHYLQTWREGVPASLLMAADGSRGAPLALTRQYAGLPWLGCRGTTYAGSIVAAGNAALPDLAVHAPSLRAQAARIADALAHGLGLRGLVGVDLVVDAEGVAWPVEVNPRWCASFELVERLLGTSLFTVHAEACAGSLPSPWPLDAGPSRVAAKGVRWRDDALADAAPASTPAWRTFAAEWAQGPAAAPASGAAVTTEPIGSPRRNADGRRSLTVADVPRPGASMPCGAPVCTLLADAPDADAALVLLREGAARIAELMPRSG